MHLEAIIEDGQVKLLHPPRLKKGGGRLSVTVIVPDDALEESPNASAEPQAAELTAAQKERAQALLARSKAVRDAALADDVPDDGLTEKQRERMEAFELRAQYRREQGRPF